MVWDVHGLCVEAKKLDAMLRELLACTGENVVYRDVAVFSIQ